MGVGCSGQQQNSLITDYRSDQRGSKSADTRIDYFGSMSAPTTPNVILVCWDCASVAHAAHMIHDATHQRSFSNTQIHALCRHQPTHIFTQIWSSLSNGN